MTEKTLLRDEIIRKVMETYAPPESGKKFSFNKLSHELKRFVLGNKTLIGDDLYYKYYRGDNLSYTVLKRSCAKDNKHPDNGAVKELRDLICYYAYRMNYRKTLEQIFGTTERKEEQESSIKILEMAVASAEKTMRTIPLINNELFENKKYDGVRIKAIINATECALMNRLEFELKREYEKYSKEISTKQEEFIYTARDLALLNLYQGEYDEAYKFCGSVLRCRKKCPLVWYITAYYCAYKKDFNNSKAFLKLIFSYTNKDYFLANLLSILIDCELKRYDSIRSQYYDFLDINIYKDNYIIPSTVSLPYLNPDTSASQYLNGRFLRNHIFFYVFYIQSHIHINTYLGKHTDAFNSIYKSLEAEPKNPFGLARKKLLLS